MGPESLKINVISATPGADSNTYNLFDSTLWNLGPGLLRSINASRLTLRLANANAGTLKFYTSTDKGTNWDQTGNDIAVAASGTTDINGPYDFLLDPYSDVKLDWVNGGSSQAAKWRPGLSMIVNDRTRGDV